MKSLGMTLPLPRAFEKRAPGLVCALGPFLERLGKKSVLEMLAAYSFKTDSVQSSSNYLQKLFTKNLLTAR